MPFRLVEYELCENTRSTIRREVVELFLNEMPGIGIRESCSKYHYIVERYGKYAVILHRPACLNKGFDFTVHIEGVIFRKNRIYTNPSHNDIMNCLFDVKENYSFKKYEFVRNQIENIFSCKSFDMDKVEGIYFWDNEGKKHPVAIILLAIKWLFIEQDITYWNWSGRNMLMEKLAEVGLV